MMSIATSSRVCDLCPKRLGCSLLESVLTRFFAPPLSPAFFCISILFAPSVTVPRSLGKALDLVRQHNPLHDRRVHCPVGPYGF